MRNRVQACGAFVIRTDDVPRRDARVGLFQHHISCAGVVVPARSRGQVHRAQFPLSQGVRHASFKAALLLGIAHFQPEFYEDDAPFDQELLDLRTQLQESSVLLRHCRTP